MNTSPRHPQPEGRPLFGAERFAAQHRLLRPVERLDARALWLGLLFLMLVAFVPFPTSVRAEHGNRDAVVLHAMTIVALSLLLSAFGAHVGLHPGWVREGEGGVYRREGFRPWAVPAVFALSIPIARLDPDWAMAFWPLLVPPGLALRR